MALTVEPEGLGSEGASLVASQVSVATPHCVPPGADATSVGSVAQLTAQSAALSALLNHAGMLRAQGGAVVALTAANLQAADERGANGFAASTGTESAAPAVGGEQQTGTLAPPALPTVPTMPPLPPLPGHVYSAQLHTGPGSASLRAFAQEWRSHAATAETSAAQTRQVAAGIAEHWVDGYHRAASNTVKHSDWLDTAAGKARSLADAAESSADHFEHARTRTPTPDDFVRTEQWRQSAIARNIASGGLDSAEVAEATAMLARQEAEATEAVGAYHAGVTDAVSYIATPIPPAPHIGNESDKPADDLPTGERPPRKLPKIDEEIHPLDVPGYNDEGLGGTLTGETAGAKSEPTNDDGTELPEPGFWSTPTDPTSATDPQAAPDAGNGTGTAVGSGLGALSQLGQLASMPSAGAGGMSGLPMSTLPSIPSLGGMPSTSSGGLPTGERVLPQPDTGLPDDATPDGTSPAGGGGGDVGGGTPGGLPAMANALPAAGTSNPTAAMPTSPAAASPATSPGGGAMGMYPPMMGHAGRGENDATDRDKRLYPDRRVVLREVPNTEPVFGEVAQESRRRPNRVSHQEEAE